MDKMETGSNLLSSRACVVKVKFPRLKDEASACGTILYPELGIVLCHGSIFMEFALGNSDFASQIQNGQLLTAEDIGETQFSILLDGRLGLQKRKEERNLSSISIESSTCTGCSVSDFTNVNCEYVCAFRNNDFHSAVCSIMPNNNWLFIDSEDANKKSSNTYVKSSAQRENKENFDDRISFHLLSYFVILKCEALSCVSQERPFISNSPVPKLACMECRIGQTAELITTPFGALCPSVFFNSYSRGVISNISGRKNCWIITDARCVPGSEGGPLFITSNPEDDTRYLSGVIVSSLCWKNNEWIGFSVACSINSILESILEQYGPHTKPLHQSLSIQTGKIQCSKSDNIPLLEERFLLSTVLVQVGSTWGSGVIVDKTQGLVVTCSHVIKDADRLPVLITPYQSSSKYPASIIYRQKSLKGPYDIAVLKCCKATSHLPADWSLDVSAPSIGQEVCVIGHAVFSVHLSLRPSWCQGVVSKIIGHHSKPVLVQTTCAVHPGVSGGPLFSSDGKLVGIVICNTKDSSSNTSFPHINMSVPFVSIWPVIQHYLQKGEKEILSALVLNNSQVSKLWSLGQATSENCLNPVKSKL